MKYFFLAIVLLLPFVSASESIWESFDDSDEIYSFIVSSFVEGVGYSFDWFELLVKAGDFSGEDFSGDFVVDLTVTPDVEIDGDSYSASSGTFGLFTVPIVAAAEYCGDSVCSNGEDCSSCSIDCGECVVSVVSGGGGTSRCIEGYLKIDGKCVLMENETQEEIKPVEEEEIVDKPEVPIVKDELEKEEEEGVKYYFYVIAILILFVLFVLIRSFKIKKKIGAKVSKKEVYKFPKKNRGFVSKKTIRLQQKQKLSVLKNKVSEILKEGENRG